MKSSDGKKATSDAESEKKNKSVTFSTCDLIFSIVNLQKRENLHKNSQEKSAIRVR